LDGSTAPLEGIRIVEVSSYVATPLCGLTLAQLGADVIRVEPVGGAPDRNRWPLAPNGTSLYWAGLNKNKRAIEVDLTTDAGRGLVADLAAECGIVLSNSERHLTFDDLRARRHDVIHVLLTGNRDGSTAVDYTVNAATGFPMLTGPAGGSRPVNHVLPAWDIAAGLYLAVGLLAAAHRRSLTGRAQQVRVALADVALATAGNLGYLAEAQLRGEPRRPDGNYVYGSFGHDFMTEDGQRLMVVALTTRHWRDLVRATRTSDVLATLARSLGADFDAEADRYRHRRVLAAVLAEWFEARPYAEVEAALRDTRVLWSVYRSFTDLAADDARHLRTSPLMHPLDQPGVGPHLAPGSPIVFGDTEHSASAAPAIGEHTRQVLCGDLGLTQPTIDELVEAGAIPPVNNGPTTEVIACRQSASFLECVQVEAEATARPRGRATS
jgi:2-methylfumaryl-CoA isomerase